MSKSQMIIDTRFIPLDDGDVSTQAREFQLPADRLANRAVNSNPQDAENFAGQPDPDENTQKLIDGLQKLQQAGKISQFSFSGYRVLVRADAKRWNKVEPLVVKVITDIIGEVKVVRA